MKKERKLDIFALLRATDIGDGNWLSRQSAEVQKEFQYQASMVMRWVATVSDGVEAAYMLWLTNERVNQHLYRLYQHPDLVFRLLASCGLGTIEKHQWVAGTRKTPANAAVDLVRAQYPEANESEIAMLMSLFTRESFKHFMNECGVQEKDAKEVVAAYDQQYPNETTNNKAKSKQG